MNIKSTKSDVTPTTLSDFQAVLDNAQVMTGYNSILGAASSDNIIIPDNYLNSVDATSRNAYLWLKDIFGNSPSYDWQYCYQMVGYSNIVLDGLNKLTSATGTIQVDNIRGSALFYRAFAFYQLSQLFCKPYVSASATTDLGIPIRLTSDVNIHTSRGTVQQCYDQITSDLKAAITLLPQTPLYKTRPCSVAAAALLAKVYLAMSDYKDAYLYADGTLKSYSTLLDYNTLSVSQYDPFPTFKQGNPEIIYYATSYGLSVTWPSSDFGRVDTSLYRSYDPEDLRKVAFYAPDATTGLFIFIGSYDQSYNFCGIATDEIYLIRAECSARAGNVDAAISDLNALLKHRYLSTAFVPFAASDNNILLTKILLERRKELPFTGNIRWEDLRRLNMDQRFKSTINRVYNGTIYSLEPGNDKYVLPIPQDAIQLDGLQQNLR